MNELELYTRSWGATAVPFGPLSELQWVNIASQQRALSLLNQTVALRGVMLLSGGNGLGKPGQKFTGIADLPEQLAPGDHRQSTNRNSLLASSTRASAAHAARSSADRR